MDHTSPDRRGDDLRRRPPLSEESTPLAVLAGKEYGTGSSRDWAAKGPSLLGVRFVMAESYERIHRSNLVGMGILPLQYPEGRAPRRSVSPAERLLRPWARRGGAPGYDRRGRGGSGRRSRGDVLCHGAGGRRRRGRVPRRRGSAEPGAARDARRVIDVTTRPHFGGASFIDRRPECQSSSPLPGPELSSLSPSSSPLPGPELSSLSPSSSPLPGPELSSLSPSSSPLPGPELSSLSPSSSP